MLNLDPATLISTVGVLLIAFPVHEFAHALTATMFGDDTPRLFGRLTLNPLAHLDFLGSLMLFVVGFGWAKPVPVNGYALERRAPSALMWVSLAGPFSNLVLAILGAIPFRLGLVSPMGASAQGGFLPTLEQFLLTFVYLNLALLFFNLLPLAPLDGEKILIYLLPDNLARSYEAIRPYGPMILLVLVMAGSFLGVSILSGIIGPPVQFLFRLLVA